MIIALLKNKVMCKHFMLSILYERKYVIKKVIEFYTKYEIN